MPLLATEAAKLRQDDLQRGVIEEILITDELFALLPFTSTKDRVYSYVREGAAPNVAFYGEYDDLEESAGTYVEVDTKLRALGGQVDISNFIDTTESSLNSQTALQLVAKAKAMTMEYRKTLVQGDNSTNPLAFDGIRRLTPAAQTLEAGANGAAVSYEMLDELIDTVKLGPDCLMMRQGTWRAIKALNRTFGGNTGDMVQLPNFGRAVPAIEGVPIILNEFIPADEVQGTANDTTSIYALRMNEADGLHGLYAERGSLGWVFESPGLHFSKDVTRHRLKWYTGLALKATHAIGRIKGVTNI